MKRENLISKVHIKEKKIKLTKDEKKALEKQNRKLRKIEEKKVNPVKDWYTGDCEYYFENGLRKVVPYYYTYQSFVKMRWIGQSVKEVFMREFYAGKEEYFLSRIKAGYLRINEEVCTADHVLSEQDIITHKVHRHELPILDKPLKVVTEDDDVLILCKPSSIPIHSVSKYHFNTVMGILNKSLGYPHIRVVHRLDRMTSGILIFAKHYEKAAQLSTQIKDRLVSKYYLAVVNGKFSFPSVECNQSLGVLCHKLGLWCVQTVEDGGKEASTKFTFLQYDPVSDTSLVLCKPNTGRTHQIRIHLQYLGYPIISDPLYNSEAWGPEKGKSALYHKSKEELIKDLQSNHTINFHQSLETGIPYEVGVEDCDSVESCDPPKNFDKDCEECVSKVNYNLKADSLILHLHAYRYQSQDGNWDYFTDLPDWISPFTAQDPNILRTIQDMTKCDS